jgi:inhibitor of cysteine peptidase
VSRARLSACAALLAAVAGCATPPMPREITDAADGARVRLAVAQELVVGLDGNQTTGFRWVLSRPATPVVVQVGDATYSARGADSRLVGAGGVTTFRFKAEKTGESQLVFVYRRPWEANIPPARTVRFDVKVE